MPLGHVLNRGGAEWIRIHLAVPGVGDADVQLATVPVTGIDEPADVDPVTHVFEIEIGQRRVDGKVERGGPGEADHPGRGGGQRSAPRPQLLEEDRKSTRLNSSHRQISYAVFCLKKKRAPIHQVHMNSHPLDGPLQSAFHLTNFVASYSKRLTLPDTPVRSQTPPTAESPDVPVTLYSILTASCASASIVYSPASTNVVGANVVCSQIQIDPQL